jgi:hypothetical protein
MGQGCARRENHTGEKEDAEALREAGDRASHSVEGGFEKSDTVLGALLRGEAQTERASVEAMIGHQSRPRRRTLSRNGSAKERRCGEQS